MLGRKDTFLYSNIGLESDKSSVFCVDTLNLIRVDGCWKTDKFCDSVSGTVRPIDIRTLRSIERQYFTKGSFSENKDYIVFSYPDRPIIYVRKCSGLLYGLSNSPLEQKQAWHLLRILCKFGYVDGYSRRQQGHSSKVHITEGWIQ